MKSKEQEFWFVKPGPKRWEVLEMYGESRPHLVVKVKDIDGHCEAILLPIKQYRWKLLNWICRICLKIKYLTYDSGSQLIEDALKKNNITHDSNKS
jgi:hypothetical protein